VIIVVGDVACTVFGEKRSLWRRIAASIWPTRSS